ncbi:hypothetical protein VMCG_06517 [Cytospora schulzeri]|uniref:Uncharacterized protein n=1 Tax=Cytospora schulzeri TaxID=448051 RepID=A0A423WC09_9PEZI|nr:hypothetical protein VMCG_06517 [Valsa malicola]
MSREDFAAEVKRGEKTSVSRDDESFAADESAKSGRAGGWPLSITTRSIVKSYASELPT